MRRSSSQYQSYEVGRLASAIRVFVLFKMIVEGVVFLVPVVMGILIGYPPAMNALVSTFRMLD